ncbi:MAG: hypothetical protein AB8E15_02600 [Bdellovibrionales bacterium]
MPADVIRFAQSDELCRYILLQSESFDNSQLFSLSPHTMRWDKDLYFIDVQATENYWRLKAKYHNELYSDFLLKKITESFPQAKIYTAKHPWQALLLLKAMGETAEKNYIYSFHSKLGENLFKTLKWEEWLSVAKQVLKYYDTKNIQLDGGKTRSKILQFEKAMERLGLEGPEDLKEADLASIRKRFGNFIERLWEWSFPEKSKRLPLFQSLDDLKAFPWLACDVPVHYKAFQLLEYPCEYWEHIEAFLKEDCKKLFEQVKQRTDLRVCKIDWRLHLYDGRDLQLPVYFRNPYSLHKESEKFTSLLQQANYSFHSWQKDLKEEKDYSTYPEAYKIVSWELVITEFIFHSEDSLELVASEDTYNIYNKLLDIENKLPRSLENYQVRESFLVDQSFQLRNEKAQLKTFTHLQWKNAGSLRPLFIHKKHKSIPAPYRATFLERCSRNWWNQHSLRNYRVDYFKSLDRQSQRWLSKDIDGKWMEYGSFD